MDTENSSFRYFSTKDADPEALKDERIAVLGYGNLGRPFALNLRDSGVTSLVIGNDEDHYFEKAKEEGFQVVSIQQAAAQADILVMLLPDEIIPIVYDKDFSNKISPGTAVVFASGYSLAYDLIEPSPEIDVLLLAPRMAGENARQRFLQQKGFYAYISVEQDASGKAWKRLLGLAHAVGVLYAGAFELNAKREADLDLLVEQTIGAALGVSIMNVFAQGVEAGIPAEAMVMEMYMSEEMEMVWRSFREVGFFNASRAHGPTALFGGFQRTMELMGSDLSNLYSETLKKITSGDFARDFQAERDAGYPILSRAEQMSMEDSPIALAERTLRQKLINE